ncbi:Pycsar system effector family protein [Streptomyces sp. NPDC051001]|uniref:Pycsar system effector family protein n=1 Tax=Streptomyces sp. NPDC051001 TaxID=3155795 RepID=UPI00342E8457
MDSRAEQEAATVRSELQSANTQASVVLAVVAIAAGAFADHLGTLLQHSLFVTCLAVPGIVAVAGAVWLLLSAVLPRLDASGRGSFQTWAGCDREQLRDALAADYHLDELGVISRIAVAKYRRLRWAGRLLQVGFVLLAASGLGTCL